MKKERNCGGNAYPVYPAYNNMPIMNQGYNPMMTQGMTPMMGQNMMMQAMPNNIMMPTSLNNTSMGNDYSTLATQVNSLERRVSRLESMIGSNTNMAPKYNESNYYMV